MKRIIFILILITVSFGSFGQRITFNDLEYVLSNSLDDVEALMLKKGFEYSGIEDYGKASAYNYTKNSSSSPKFMSVAKYIYNDTCYQSYFFTAVQSDYMLLKAEIKRLGFKLNETIRNKQDITYYYIKGKLEIEFTIALGKHVDIPVYTIILANKLLKRKRYETTTD